VTARRGYHLTPRPVAALSVPAIRANCLSGAISLLNQIDAAAIADPLLRSYLESACNSLRRLAAEWRST
jgi:hypothetical protein